ncbi:Calx-beta domain-containing protein [Falsiroseomonas stagni]|uniref:Calx-beta domain-containing protein n=1 Tax=Falsiroseomonas stagni DSM 19981 TaxID=1123062 RepID=A0A1I4CK27_9PROT|nr:Calx-beta domain-containing protein [Falsiroseomonas stagni]SFK80291.1 Calx-beta domain-containing protein [Falsiroseomonas stagni DSM 19981]
MMNLNSALREVVEGNTLALVLERGAGDSKTYTVVWTVTGVRGDVTASDFAFGGVLPGGTFVLGASEASRTILIPTIRDSVLDPDEAIFVVANMTDQDGNISSVGRRFDIVADHDVIYSVRAVADSVAEGTFSAISPGLNTISFDVTRNSVRGQASITLDAAGSGLWPTDAADFPLWSPASQVVTFAPGQTTQRVSFVVNRDSVAEPNESFTVRLRDAPSGSTILVGEATTVIRDDDSRLSVTAQQGPLVEGTTGPTEFRYLVSRIGDASQALTVDWRLSTTNSSLAANIDDFDPMLGTAPASSGSLTLAAGESSGTLSIWIKGDSFFELNEVFDVSFTSTLPTIEGSRVFTSTIRSTILNDDASVAVTNTGLEILEGNAATSGQLLRLTRSGNTHLEQSLDWAVLDPASRDDLIPTWNYATAADFPGGILPSGRAVFAIGQSTTTIFVPVATDDLLEGMERVLFGLSNPSPGLDVRSASSPSLWIRDVYAGFTILPGGTSASESGDGALRISVERRGPLTDTASVAWTLEGLLDSADFAPGTPLSGRLTFAPGQQVQVVVLPILDDAGVEALRETATFRLSDPSPGMNILNGGTVAVEVLDDDATMRVTGASQVTEGQAGTTLLTYTLHREGYIADEASVNWAVVPDATRGQAVDAADFVGRTLPTGIATFAAGASTTTVTIAVAGDTRSEPNEYFTFNVAPTMPSLRVDTHQMPVTIVNDDPRIEAGTYSRTITEGHGGVTTMVIPLLRIGDTSGTDVVGWAASRSLSGVPAVVQARDFVGGALPTGSVTFAPGETMKEVVLSFVADSIAEAPEAFFRLALTTTTAGLGLGNAITGSLRDDDMVFDMQSGTVERAEGQAGTTPFIFTVTRAGLVTEAASVAWAVAGNGSAPADAADFAGGVLPSGTLSFAAGETSRTITVNVAGDRVAERAERFTVTLATTTANQSLGDADALGIILPDDSSVAITAHQAVRTEGHAGETTPFTFHVTRTGATDAAQSVAWSVAGTGASRTSASDFVGGAPPSGIVEFAAGETRKTITVNVSGDSTRELDETFVVRLSSPTNGLLLGQAEAQGTILRDETVMAITSTTGSAVEGNGGTTPFTFTVTRSGYLDAVQTASWSVVGAGGNGTSAADFAGASTPRGTIRFEAGETTRTITVNVASDGLVERDESFAVRLTAASPGVAFSPSQAVATILNDDTGVGITALSASKAEGQSGTTPFTFAITRTGVLDAEQSVSWATGGFGANRATAADFAGRVLPSGTVTFLAGEAQKVITLDVLGDTVVEAAEAFIIRLSTPSAGLVTTTPSATGLIANDDPAPTARLLASADWVL